MPKVNTRTNINGTTIYYVRTRDGLGRQTTESFRTEREAQKFAKEVETIGGKAAIARRRRKDAADPDAYVPTVAEMLTRHIDQLTGVTERTRLDYAAMARRTWLPLIGERDVDELTRAGISAVINELDARGLSAKSIANAQGLLSSMMRTALIDGLIDTNPCRGIRLPKSTATEAEMRFLTLAEYRSLLDATPAHWQPLVALLFGSGLRWSEAIALTVGDITTVGTLHFASVSKAWKATPGKGRHIGPPKSAKSRRQALLSTEAYALIEPLLDRPRAERLFTTPAGGDIWIGPFRDRAWVPAARKAGLASPEQRDTKGKLVARYDGPRIHDARHTHASWLLSAGATLEQVQDQLGHESILTTRKVYGHLLPETRNRLADALNAAMGSARSLRRPGAPNDIRGVEVEHVADAQEVT